MVVTVGNRSEQTSARSRTCDPAWEQAITFLVCNPESDDLNFKVSAFFLLVFLESFVTLGISFCNLGDGSEDWPRIGREKDHLGVAAHSARSRIEPPASESEKQRAREQTDRLHPSQGTAGSSSSKKHFQHQNFFQVLVPGQPVDDGLAGTDSGAAEPTPLHPKQPSPPPPPPPLPSNLVHQSSVISKDPSPPKSSGATNNSHHPATEGNGHHHKQSIPSLDQAVGSTIAPILTAAKISLDRESSMRRRKGGLPPGVVSQVQITLRYSNQRQRLIVVIHKVR